MKSTRISWKTASLETRVGTMRAEVRAVVPEDPESRWTWEVTRDDEATTVASGDAGSCYEAQSEARAAMERLS